MTAVGSAQALYARMCKKSVLDKAFHAVSRSSSPNSCGPDGVTLEEFARNWPANRMKLRDALQQGTYVSGKYLGCAIRKPNHRPDSDLKAWRPISIANIADRVVQRSLLDAGWTSLRDLIYTDTSFGGVRKYRVRRSPGGAEIDEDEKRCVRSAAKRIVQLRDDGNDWVFETDIESFFPSIGKQRLIEKLPACFKEAPILPLVEAAIDTAIQNYENFPGLEKLWNSETGVPQGGVLSPILANLYLHDFDRALTRAGYKMVRYVDDLVILTKSGGEARRAHSICREELQKLGLTIHPLANEFTDSKTRIHAPGSHFDFLGLRFHEYAIKPTPNKVASVFEKLAVLLNPTRSRATLNQLLTQINACVYGWMQAYKFCNFSDGELDEFDRRIAHLVRVWLKRRGIIRKPEELSISGYQWLGVEGVRRTRIEPLIKRRTTRKHTMEFLAKLGSTLGRVATP